MDCLRDDLAGKRVGVLKRPFSKPPRLVARWRLRWPQDILPGIKVMIFKCRVDAQLPLKVDQRIVLMLLTQEEGRGSTG